MPRLTVKEKIRNKIFTTKYIENGMNGTKTIQDINPAMSSKVAGVTATRLLGKASIQASIEKVMEENGLSNDLVINAHKENIIQKKHLPSRNQAIEMYYKIKGAYKDNASSHLHIHTSPDEITKRIKELESELESA